ncbi:MAG: MFS transporter, partial [Ilumatobacteraceae bacterium]
IEPDIYDRRWKILAVLCSCLIIVIVGNTFLNVALPTLADPEQLGASNTELQWMVDSYALVFAGLLFTAGALGDRFGRKGALQAGLVVFALGSLVGAVADSPGQVIVGRSIMGLAAAFIMPSTLSILTNVFPGRERAKAIAIWAGISGAGAAIGPVTSGLLLERFWWGSVLLINLPIIAVAFVACWILVPRSKDSTASPLDPVGALLSIIGFSALIFAIIEGPNHGWSSTASLLWFGAAALALAMFAWWESRIRHPMLDLRLFRDRRFAVSSGGITLVFFAMFGTFYLMSQFLQFVIGYTPLQAAVRLLPFSVIMMTVAPQTPKLVVRFGAGRVASTGMGLIGVALLGFTLFSTTTPYWQLLITVCLMAGGMALTMSPMTTELMSAVPRDRAGVGSAMNDTTRELGGALGVAVLGSLVTSRYISGLADTVATLPDEARELAQGSIGGVLGLIAQGVLPADVGSRVLDTARDAFVDGLNVAGAIAAGVVIVAAVLVRVLLPSRPRPQPRAAEAAAPVAVD